MKRIAQSTLLGVALVLVLLPAGAGAATLEGVYSMKRYSPGATGRLETAILSFQDGEVVRNPVGSAGNLDVARERAAHPRDVGTYQHEAGELTLTLGGRSMNGKLEPEAGGCFRWKIAMFCPIDGFASGAKTRGAVSMAPARPAAR